MALITKEEAKIKLTELGIAFDPEAKVADIRSLLPEESTVSQFPELDKTDFEDESEEKLEFRRIVANFRKERGEEAYEMHKAEYEAILGKLNNPDFHF